MSSTLCADSRVCWSLGSRKRPETAAGAAGSIEYVQVSYSREKRRITGALAASNNHTHHAASQMSQTYFVLTDWCC
jgi:hypothetical protein